VILITEPNFVLGQQATFSHEFEAHNVSSGPRVARRLFLTVYYA
jgi:hypothetical protein